MNKRMKDLLGQMESKRVLAKSFMEEKSKDVDKALVLLDEADELEKEFEAEKRIVDLQKQQAAEKQQSTSASNTGKNQEDSETTKAFLNGVRKRFKDFMGQREGVNEDGGYIVPQDILTKINQFKRAEFSLLPLVDYNKVKTNKGSRTFESKATATAFSQMDEAGIIEQIDNIEFQPIKYDIKNYGGFLPVTNQLLSDTDQALKQTISQWFARKSIATANTIILTLLESKGKVDIRNLDGIKKTLNVTLGQAYKSACQILTNDDGLNYLDTLKDVNGRYLLQANPSDPAKMQLRAGAAVIPITTIPNNILKSDGEKVPFIIGDFKESIAFWDREQYMLSASDVAAVGNVNAFAQNLTLFRGLQREDACIKDANSWVYGYIDTTAVPPEPETPVG